MRCALCGTENAAGSRFCDHCGSPSLAACLSCGATHRPDARFCSNCGTALAGTDAPTERGAIERAARDRASAERRLVSVLFTDLVGFTTLAEDRDPEAVRELLSTYFDTATRIIERHGGSVEKFIGDAVMAVWGTPVAHEDDAERAVRAALQLLDAVAALHPDLRARAGVLTGDAAVTLGATNQGMVAGDLVNTAARLQGVAEPGTVLVDEATRRAGERSIVFEALGSRTLKGKSSPVPAWQAVRVVAVRGGLGRADALEPPFVGRVEELRELKELLHGAGRERRPRLVSIAGPGGIGKSRLVWELEKYVDGVAEAIYWHRGRSPAYGEGITFWALGEMVRRRAQLTENDGEVRTRERIAATLAEYVADASERERIGPALLSLLGVEPAPAGGRDALFPAWRLFFERIAGRGTAVLVFEDLQWADSGLLDFIDHLLDWSRRLPILIVTLARPELFDRRPDWAVGRRHLTAVALEPLTDADMRHLLEGLVPGLPAHALAAIVGRAEGIPLYAVETVRGLLSDGLIERRGDAYAPVGDFSRMRVPETLRSLIASRLDALDSADRSLLQDAAVLGQVFTTDALAATSGMPGDELEQRLRDLVRRELLDVERDPASPELGQHKFVQALIREVAYATLARRDRRARHLGAARYYNALGDDERAGALAAHYLAAHEASDEGPEADALATQARLALSAAADRAASLGAHEQAVRYLDQAQAVAPDPADRAPLLDRAALSAGSAALVDAQRYAQAAIDAYRGLGAQAAAAAATARLGSLLLDASEIGQATRLLEAAVPEAEKLDDPAVLAQTLTHLARAYMRGMALERAVEVADRALAMAERLDLESVVAEALINKSAALGIMGRRREAVGLAGAALEVIRRVGDRSVELRIRNNHATAVAHDDLVRGGLLAREAMEVARDIGHRTHFFWLVWLESDAAYAEGRDWDGVLALLNDALDAAMLQHDRVRLRGNAALFEIARGEGLETVVSELAELVGDSGNADDRVMLLARRASVAQLSGDHKAAHADVIEALPLASQIPEDPVLAGLENAIWAGHAEHVREMAQLAAGLSRTGAVLAGRQLAAAAATAAVDGRTADGIAAFRSAHARMSRLGLRFDAARIAVAATILLPDRPEIRALAAEARPVLEELQAGPYLERLDAALAAGDAAAARERSASAAATAGAPGTP